MTQGNLFADMQPSRVDVLAARLRKGAAALDAKEAAGELDAEYDRWLAKWFQLLYVYEDLATAEGR